MKFDFVEIGSCDFDALCQTSEDWQIGLNVEVVSELLDRLPERINVKKLNAAVAKNTGIDFLYTIPESAINEYDLPTWIKECSRIGAPHPLVLEELSKRNIQNLYNPISIRTISVEEVFQKYEITQLGTFKTDLVGNDIDVINSLLDYGKVLPQRIIFKHDVNQVFETSNVDLDQLKERLNSFGYSNRGRIFNNYLFEKEVKISVVAMFDVNYQSIAEVTIFKNFTKYCSLHGYDLISRENATAGRAAQWKKIELLIGLLKGSDSEWLFFVDADCLFMNTSIKIEEFIDDDAFLILPRGGGAPDNFLSIDSSLDNIMSSQMLVRNCQESLDFFQEIWDAPDWPENMPIDEFDHEMRQMRISSQKDKWRSGIKLLDEFIFNRFWPVSSPFMAMSHQHMNNNLWKPGNFIVHVTGYDLREKLRILTDLEIFSGGLLVQWHVDGRKIFFRPLRNISNLRLFITDSSYNFKYYFEIGDVLEKMMYWIMIAEDENPFDLMFKSFGNNMKEIGFHKF
jgi:hypothetical protein